MKYKIGIDVGGTKIEIVVIDQAHNTIFKNRCLTESSKGLHKVLSNIISLYNKALLSIEKDAKYTIGIGVPGVISKNDPILKNSTIPCLNGLNIKNLFFKLFEKQIFIENDANCFALAETVMGAGMSYSSVFGLILGTGCGGGLVLNQNIINGANGSFGEIGHATLVMDGKRCFCGKNGCANAYVSGSALEELIFNKTGQSISSELFLNGKIINSDQKKEILQIYFKYLASLLLNIMCVYDPNVIVLGGGLSNYKDLICGVQNSLNDDLGEYNPIQTKILFNKLGDSGGVYGAALIGK